MCGVDGMTPPARCNRSPPWIDTATTSISSPPGRSSGSGTSAYCRTSGPPVRLYTAACMRPRLRRLAGLRPCCALPVETGGAADLLQQQAQRLGLGRAQRAEAELLDGDQLAGLLHHLTTRRRDPRQRLTA